MVQMCKTLMHVLPLVVSVLLVCLIKEVKGIVLT